MKPAAPGGARTNSAHQNASPRTSRIANTVAITNDGRKIKICLSYRTNDKPIVEQIKKDLERMGIYVIQWGLNVGQTEGKDWLNQWTGYCEEADIVLNFISVKFDR